MQTRQSVEAPIFAPLMAYVGYRIGQWFMAMRPEYTSDEIAAAVAVDNNPSGA